MNEYCSTCNGDLSRMSDDCPNAKMHRIGATLETCSREEFHQRTVEIPMLKQQLNELKLYKATADDQIKALRDDIDMVIQERDEARARVAELEDLSPTARKKFNDHLRERLQECGPASMMSAAWEFAEKAGLIEQRLVDAVPIPAPESGEDET